MAAQFDGFPYSYKKDGTKTVATFGSKVPGPGDDIVGAIRDIIERSYGDQANAAPRRVGVGAEQSIRIAGNKHQYVVVPIKEATGEIRSLIITQLTD